MPVDTELLRVEPEVESGWQPELLTSSCTVSHICLYAHRGKLWKDLYQKPGHPWLAGGDKENVFSNNMLKLYDFFPTVIYNYCKYEKTNVNKDKVQKGMETNENLDVQKIRLWQFQLWI